MKNLSQKIIEEKLSGLPLGKIAYYPSIGSTNTVAAEWAAAKVPDLSIILADEQTAGRGRSGRSWFTPAGSALAFTFVLSFKDAIDSTAISRVAGLGALAVAQGLEKAYGIQPAVKWPNDVLVDGKKLCGVLAEAHWLGNDLQALILGIGINIATQSIPPEDLLTFPATCVEEAAGQPVDRLDVLFHTVTALAAWKTKMFEPSFIEAWESKLAYRGERVQVFTHSAHEMVIGKLIGLRENGQLRLLLDSGEEKFIPAGEIHLRPLVDSSLKSDKLS